jgi:hypothetical protein
VLLLAVEGAVVDEVLLAWVLDPESDGGWWAEELIATSRFPFDCAKQVGTTSYVAEGWTTVLAMIENQAVGWVVVLMTRESRIKGRERLDRLGSRPGIFTVIR